MCEINTRRESRYSTRSFRVDVPLASLRYNLRSGFLIDRFLRDWRRRGVPPRFDDHDHDSVKNDEPIDAKEDGEREDLSLENLSIGLECSRHDLALVRGGAVAP